MEIIKWILRIIAFVLSSLAIFTKWNKKVRISLFALALTIALTSVAMIWYNALNPTRYDMYGNEYDSLDEVVYYTEDNEKYTLDRETYYFINVDNPDNKMKDDDIFLDKNGYLVSIPKENIEIDWDADDDDPYRFYDNNGERYADVVISLWDSDGNLHIR